MSGTIDIFTDPVIGEEINLKIVDKNGDVKSINEESLSVIADQVYYIHINGEIGKEYTISIE